MKETQKESELHLESLLYLLNDPALDREAFEARLAVDAQLGEILAETVLTYQSLQSIDSHAMVCLASKAGTDSMVKVTTTNSVRPISVEIGHARLRLILGTLAASLLIVGFLGWQAVYSPALRSVEIARASKMDSQSPNGSAALNSEAGTFSNVAWAWGDLRTDDRNDHQLRHAGFTDIESLLAMNEPFSDSDVPEWLVLATATVLEESDGIDASHEQSESRDLLQ